jgi:hypothetical protein
MENSIDNSCKIEMVFLEEILSEPLKKHLIDNDRPYGFRIFGKEELKPFNPCLLSLSIHQTFFRKEVK